MGKQQVEDTNIAGVRAEVLRARQQKIFEYLDKIDELMADGVELEDAMRGHTVRVRGEGEKEALSSVLDYADTQPAAFQGLANRDEGHDPKKFETDLLRHRLENAFLLGEIVDRLDRTRLVVADSALYVASLVKPPILGAYEIAKPLAKVDDKNGKKLNPALNYYGAVARAGAKTRREKKNGK